MTASVPALVSRTLLECVQEAGDLLLKYFGRLRHVRQKGEQSSVVCEADLASEELVARKIRARFPSVRIIGEESGISGAEADLTWVVDPLDGTSNFVAGLPWFGTQIGVLAGSKAICAAMYLPVEGALFYAELGKGVRRNGKLARVTPETELRNTLCAFGFDASRSASRRSRIARMLVRVGAGVRNTRATNSLVDFSCTIDGRFGGCVNLNCKIWDIVPAALMVPEAGGRFTDLRGRPIDFRLGQARPEHTYEVLGASRILHPKLVRLLRDRRNP